MSDKINNVLLIYSLFVFHYANLIFLNTLSCNFVCFLEIILGTALALLFLLIL